MGLLTLFQCHLIGTLIFYEYQTCLLVSMGQVVLEILRKFSFGGHD